MAQGNLWHRTLVYFGLAEDESLYDDDEAVTARDDLERNYRERPNVRRIDRKKGRARGEGFDEIFTEEEPDTSRRRGRSAPSSRTPREPSADMSASTSVLRAAPGSGQGTGSGSGDAVTTAVRVHVIQPRSYNDAQQIADRFKSAVPVIINLQAAEPELAKRLIDFGSGLTYALDGGMQRIAEKVFLLSPKNVQVSAEDRQRLVEQGIFNPT